MSIFSKISNSLKKTKDKISSLFQGVFSFDRIGEEFYEELEEALILSDISYDTSEEIIESLRLQMKEEKATDKEYVKSCLKNALLEQLDKAEDLELEYPAVIMVIGVNGVGKTTTIGKLAKYFTTEGKSVTIAAADTFRAAASEQLGVWADRAGVRIVKHAEGADPSAVVYDAVASVKAKNTDVLIIDTAGRLHVKANLMEELKKMDRVVEREFPEANFYKFIALDATTGNNAINQVEEFSSAVGLDGILLTKLDGTAKGGFVFSLCGKLEVPVAFVGTGEGIDDLELFDKEAFVDGIL